jgi:hypothetical protein
MTLPDGYIMKPCLNCGSNPHKPARIILEAKGWRDLYWCYILNEPVIIEYKDGQPFCTNCNGNPLKGQEHSFIFHILKP